MSTATHPWHARRTDETRKVEEILKQGGFAQVDAYRYNSASIRVRVIDPRFAGTSREARDAMVEPSIDRLPPETQGDIVNLFVFAPDELQQPAAYTRECLLNAEFEDPTPSNL